MDAETSRFSGPKVEAWEPNDEGRPDGRPSRSRSAGLQGSCKSYALVGRDSGGGIRTRDLRVMSPTSYQTAPPRVATFLCSKKSDQWPEKWMPGTTADRQSRAGRRLERDGLAVAKEAARGPVVGQRREPHDSRRAVLHALRRAH